MMEKRNYPFTLNGEEAHAFAIEVHPFSPIQIAPIGNRLLANAIIRNAIANDPDTDRQIYSAFAE